MLAWYPPLELVPTTPIMMDMITLMDTLMDTAMEDMLYREPIQLQKTNLCPMIPALDLPGGTESLHTLCWRSKMH